MWSVPPPYGEFPLGPGLKPAQIVERLFSVFIQVSSLLQIDDQTLRKHEFNIVTDRKTHFKGNVHCTAMGQKAGRTSGARQVPEQEEKVRT